MRGRRVLVGLNLFVGLCLAVTAAGYGYVRWQFSRVDSQEIPSTTGASADDGPITVLLVGSDSRKGLSGKDRKAFGTEAQSGGERSDVIMLVRLDKKAGTARSMSIPRDLWVPIAGTGKEAKINAAYEGGPDRLVATIRDALGIPIDHYVQVDFKAFRGVVDALGGVDIPFEAPARDTVTGLSVKKPGCVHLDGDAALQYVRSRNFEVLQRGVWRLDQRQDLGRIERQQGFMRQLAAQADVPANFQRLNKLVSSLVTNLTVDSQFAVSDMTDLALAFRGRGAQAIQMVTLPVEVGRTHGQSVVFLGDGHPAAVDQLLGRGVREAQAPPAPADAPTDTSAPRLATPVC